MTHPSSSTTCGVVSFSAGPLLNCHERSARETNPTGLPVQMHADDMWELVVAVKRKATLERSAPEPRVSPIFIKTISNTWLSQLKDCPHRYTEDLASRNESRLILLTDYKRLPRYALLAAESLPWEVKLRHALWLAGVAVTAVQYKHIVAWHPPRGFLIVDFPLKIHDTHLIMIGEGT